MVIPESHYLQKKTAVVSVIPNRYYFKNVLVVAVIPKLYFQHRITFKPQIVVAVIPNRFLLESCSLLALYQNGISMFAFLLGQNKIKKKTVVVSVMPKRYYFQTRVSGPTMVFLIKACPCR